MSHYILSIDQGTTSSRAIIFDAECRVIASAQQDFQQYFPQPGWVEHDADEIWQSVVSVCRQAMAKSGLKPSEIKGIGISNQRETTILWHKQTGQVIGRAIVWQDRRTADYCEKLKQQNIDPILQQKTGLLMDPYFSASKIRWLLDHYPEAQQFAEQNQLAFGTVESFLIFKLTGGKRHVSDVTNASRTAIFNINNFQWDEELLSVFNIPKNILPEVLPNTASFGLTVPELFGAPIAITGAAGDQQAAMLGQACTHAGMLKTTLGTGAFLMLNTGGKIVFSKHRLLTTVAYQIGDQRAYAVEGSVFNAGTVVKWLRDELHLIQEAKDTEGLAQSLQSNDGVYLVPAFTGLAAPYWQPELRAMIHGMTRGTNRAHFARAALESVAYQLLDIKIAMGSDAEMDIHEMRMDGGLTANAWLMQFIADMLSIPVLLPANSEASCLGAALLAGIGVGVYNSLTEATGCWRSTRKFLPTMQDDIRQQNYDGWQEAIRKLLA